MASTEPSVRKMVRHLSNQPQDAFKLREFLGLKTEDFKLKTTPVPFSAMTQNMALVVSPVSYKGTNRGAAVLEIIKQIKALSPDVVGLCEVFSDSERQVIRSSVIDTHPFYIEGPDSSNPVSDGGCLVLSKHPTVAKNYMLYKDATGGDIAALKGALHMRIKAPTIPVHFDIFYSHSQNIEVSGGQEVLYRQMMKLGIFINTYADPKNIVLVMGDLNMPGEVPQHHKELLNRLGGLDRPNGAVDLWIASGGAPDAHTFVAANNFYANHHDNPKLNRRLDYIIMRAPRTFVPIVKNMEILKFIVNGRNMSDHFGLHATFEKAMKIVF